MTFLSLLHQSPRGRTPVPALVFRAVRGPWLWLGVGVLFACAGCVPAARETGEPIERRLTILHSSEHHGAALPLEVRRGRNGRQQIGGMAYRATLIKAIRAEAEHVLLVDSGDLLIGTAMSSFFRGEPDIKAMNLMGYQAMTAGNHDFDFGLDHLTQLSKLAAFPILCSNVTGRHTELPCHPFIIIPAGDLSIGLIGLLGRSNFPATFNRQVVTELAFQDPIATARRLARELKSSGRADLVIAVTHQDTEEDRLLLHEAPELDVIIGGHTEGFDGLLTPESPTPQPDAATPGTVFVKTHRQGATLGRLDLVVTTWPTGGRAMVVRATAANLPVTPALKPDPVVQTLLDEYADKLEAEAGTVMGKALVDLNGETGQIRSRETNLGNLLADILRREFGTDVALVNGGQIRDSIPAGPVDIKRVLQVLPFDSQMVTFTITGEALVAALENSVSQFPGRAGRFLQVSGLTVTYDLSLPPGSRVHAVSINGEPLDPAQRYSVATDIFLVEGGDGYTMFEHAQDRLNRQVPLRDLLLKELATRSLTATTDGRIQFMGPRSHPAPKTHEKG